MARGNRIVRGRRSGQKNQVWVSTVANDVQFDDTPAIEFNIVQGSDWEVTGSAEKATVLRIRGWMVVNKDISQASCDWFCGIYMVDEDAGVQTPAGLGLYTDEDVLWSTGGGSANLSTTASGNQDFREIDVKAMRRIGNGQQIRMTFASNVSGVNFSMSGVTRALVRRGGN